MATDSVYLVLHSFYFRSSYIGRITDLNVCKFVDFVDFVWRSEKMFWVNIIWIARFMVLILSGSQDHEVYGFFYQYFSKVLKYLFSIFPKYLDQTSIKKHFVLEK